MPANRRSLYWDVREYSRAARAYLDIRAHEFDANYDQQAFAWGDPGTESGHSIDTVDTDRTVEQDGNGDYDAFLRFEIEQDAGNADLLLSQSFRLQYQVDGGGYATVPTTAGSNPVYMVDNANITQGGDTTDNGWGTSTFTFVTNNNGIADTSSDTGVCTFTADSQEFIEVLYSLRFQDAQISAGAVFDFRVVFGAGGDTTAGTALNSYTVANATLTWNAPASFIGEDYEQPDFHHVLPTPEVTVFA